MMQRLGAFAVALALGATTATAEEPTREYVGIKRCKVCHGRELYGDQVARWRESPHAKAYEALASEAAAEVARARGISGSPQQADQCLRCHVTAHGVQASLIKYDLERSDGVQCESCHGPGADYRKRSVMADRAKSIENGLVLPTQEVCVGCHNRESPSWDPKRYTLPDGSTAGFDFEQAKKKIAHPTPEDVRGRVLEIEAERKKKKLQQ